MQMDVFSVIYVYLSIWGSPKNIYYIRDTFVSFPLLQTVSCLVPFSVIRGQRAVFHRRKHLKCESRMFLVVVSRWADTRKLWVRISMKFQIRKMKTAACEIPGSCPAHFWVNGGQNSSRRLKDNFFFLLSLYVVALLTQSNIFILGDCMSGRSEEFKP